MKALVYVTLKQGVLDPQGKAVTSGLHALGFEGVNDVRVGTFFEVDVSGEDASHARLEEMSAKLLANTVIEDFRVELVQE